MDRYHRERLKAFAGSQDKEALNFYDLFERTYKAAQRQVIRERAEHLLEERQSEILASYIALLTEQGFYRTAGSDEFNPRYYAALRTKWEPKERHSGQATRDYELLQSLFEDAVKRANKASRERGEQEQGARDPFALEKMGSTTYEEESEARALQLKPVTDQSTLDEYKAKGRASELKAMFFQLHMGHNVPGFPRLPADLLPRSGNMPETSKAFQDFSGKHYISYKQGEITVLPKIAPRYHGPLIRGRAVFTPEGELAVIDQIINAKGVTVAKVVTRTGSKFIALSKLTTPNCPTCARIARMFAGNITPEIVKRSVDEVVMFLKRQA